MSTLETPIRLLLHDFSLYALRFDPNNSLLSMVSEFGALHAALLTHSYSFNGKDLPTEKKSVKSESEHFSPTPKDLRGASTIFSATDPAVELLSSSASLDLSGPDSWHNSRLFAIPISATCKLN